MDPTTLMLIKVFSDLGMLAMQTIARANEMTQEEKEAAIAQAEAVSNSLTAIIRSH